MILCHRRLLQIIYSNASKSALNKIQKCQNFAARVIKRQGSTTIYHQFLTIGMANKGSKEISAQSHACEEMCKKGTSVFTRDVYQKQIDSLL